MRKAYPSDLSDSEWAHLRDLLPSRKTGRPTTVDLREVIHAIFYLLRSGCSWRMLPHDFPNWKTVYSRFSRWKKDGTWRQIHDETRTQCRQELGRDPQPSAMIIDSQSVKTTEKGGSVGRTRERKSTEENALLWSIRKAS